MTELEFETVQLCVNQLQRYWNTASWGRRNVLVEGETHCAAFLLAAS